MDKLTYEQRVQEIVDNMSPPIHPFKFWAHGSRKKTEEEIANEREKLIKKNSPLAKTIVAAQAEAIRDFYAVSWG